MTDLSIHITTFNCGRALPSVSHLADAFSFDFPQSLPPDLIVLCLQEFAPLGYSFLGGSYIAPYFSRLSNAVHNAVDPETEYETLLAQNVGMTGLMVFVRAGVRERIRWVETAEVGVGVWEMGNKGALGARLGLESEGGEIVPVTFVSAHLAPSEDKCERRNEDWKNICENLVFTSKSPAAGQDLVEAAPLLGEPSEDNSTTGNSTHSLFDPPSHIFFAGDLNYRTSDLGPHPDDHKDWPSPSNTTAFAELFEQDQLTRELNAGNTLHLLAESKVTFPPTYKYSASAQQHAASQAAGKPSSEPTSEAWAKHRVPSWCDRILHLATSPPKIHSYKALPIQPTSDHRPVALTLTLVLRPVDAGDVKPPFQVRRGWRERRVAARRLEVLVGIAAYLGWTWEGEALLLGTIVGILGGTMAVRALLGA